MLVLNQKHLLTILFSVAAVSSFPQREKFNYDEFYNQLCSKVIVGILAHPESCFQYIKCDHSNAEVVTCPEDYIFSTDQIECVPGNQERCLEPEPEPVEPSCENGYQGRLACPGHCDKYYSCSGGTARLESCLEGYVYVHKFQLCLPGYAEEDLCKLYNAD
ncbi:peritrophin-1-like [Uranotaenia lowii]|uniref:peritrophin-1-like n=1 Tax=Uranotaenia lowii TaxID=190385 RepID=UPI00247975A0|nr:peritrophin-1-like [Uranotaenia lowii]